AGLYAADKWKNYDKAAQFAQKALQLDPSRAGAYVVLAQVYVVKEQWAELDKILAKSEKELPDNFVPHYVSARTLLLAGKDLARAERYFRKYLTQEPEGGTPPLAATHWRLGQVLEKLGRKDEAIKEIQLGVDLKPGLDKPALEAAQKDLKRLKG
ncbi:MAG TPA: tetratricopeptide repeat protein, partial [Alphaproteobacteria bacterium]|nr:tetratricopeptide repeat protein [Alphaproteobacteria bacterium]